MNKVVIIVFAVAFVLVVSFFFFGVRSLQREGLATSNLPGFKENNKSKVLSRREERKAKLEELKEAERRRFKWI